MSKKTLKTFVGRENELQILEQLSGKSVASLVVVRGRRRIGKSRLVSEFAKDKRFIKFSGLAPEEGMTAEDQRINFIDQMQAQFKIPRLASDNWNTLFYALTDLFEKEESVVVLFDEVTWMAHDDPTFLPKLKNFWDDYAIKNPKFIFILCSSVSSWIDENILGGKAFYGRVTNIIGLEELSLSELKQLMKNRGIQGSAMELLTALSVTGGVPWYIELFDPVDSIYNNIKKLCFTKNGILTKEFSRIFGELFSKRSETYRRIVLTLLESPLTQQELSEKLSYSNSGQLSEYLNNLSVAGFISKDFNWSLTTGKLSRISKWRLSDNYTRFYLKYIEPKLGVIDKNISESVMPENFNSIMGLQFENLVLNNNKYIIKELGIDRSQIVFDNPYIQKPGNSKKGCQIDYLIQTKLNTLFVCEITFSKNPIGKHIIESVNEKITRLVKPKGFTCIPVIIHVNGVTDELEDEGYFYKIIDFGKLLES